MEAIAATLVMLGVMITLSCLIEVIIKLRR